MVTKKENNTTPEIVKICLDSLKKANERTDYLGKFEKEGSQDPYYPNSYKTILIKFHKFCLSYPMTKEEYDKYKILEAKWWHKKK